MPFLAKIGLSAFVLVLAAGVILWNCHRGRTSRTAMEFKPDGGVFVLLFAEGSGAGGYNVLEIAPGSCTYTFQAGWKNAGTGASAHLSMTWKRAVLQIDGQTLESLKKVIEKTHLFQLNEQYHGRTSDGTQTFVGIKWGDRKKSIFCDNLFPGEIRTLTDFIHSDILLPHQAEIDAAVVIDRAEGERKLEIPK